MPGARCGFLLAALLALSACGGAAPAETAETAGTALELADAILESQSELPPLELLTPDQEEFAPYASGFYGIDPGGLEDGAIYYAGGVEASEIAVLVFSGEEEAQAAEDALSGYLAGRADSFTGYVPDQAALVHGSTAAVRGRYAALLICPDPEAAEDAFSACFAADWAPPPEDPAVVEIPVVEAPAPEPSEPPKPPTPQSPPSEVSEEPAEASGGGESPEGETPETGTLEAGTPQEPPAEVPPAQEAAPPPETSSPAPDEYDHDAVLSAWRSGDSDRLGEKNRMVLDAAFAILAGTITQDMTDYQRELAIHDYITAHGRYDPDANSNAPDAAPDPDNDNPYGLLVNGVGICRGYVSTFQLLMDLLDMECVTVEGRSGSRDHAWNMVRLDGEWYCVDVTWDDPSRGQPTHRYFNVTSQFLRQTNHQWDQSGVPEATATRWAYGEQ